MVGKDETDVIVEKMETDDVIISFFVLSGRRGVRG